MRFLVLTLFLSACACGTNEQSWFDPWSAGKASGPGSSQPTRGVFDAHYHLGLMVEQPSGVQPIVSTALSRPDVAGAFLITPNYYSSTSSVGNNGNQINRLFSEAIALHSTYRLLCAIPFESSESVEQIAEFANRCLDLPNAVGLKIWGYAYKPITGMEGTFQGEKFQRLFQIAHQRRALFLVHFTYAGPDDNAYAEARTRRLIDDANRNPDATLIIAHSGTSSFIRNEGLRQIGAYYRNNTAARNVYLDISATFNQMLGIYDGLASWDASPFREQLEVWRDFDFNYVLHGSDDGQMNECYQPDCQLSIWDAPISEAEKAAVASGNALRLLGDFDSRH